MNLFESLENINKQTPLAEALRPKTLDEYLGQNRIISENSPLYRLLQSNRLFSFIFWGPPGCGKTTLARLIAEKTNSHFLEISAVTSGIKEIKDAVETAKEQLRLGRKTLLFIDEIHRYNKTQQDALLPHIENGLIYLVGSTTENPSFQVIPALRPAIYSGRSLYPVTNLSSPSTIISPFLSAYMASPGDDTKRRKSDLKFAFGLTFRAKDSYIFPR